MRTNCDNCGAPLVDGTCLYCGTQWFTPGISFGSGYIAYAKLEMHRVQLDAGRDLNGRMCMTNVRTEYVVDLKIIGLTPEETKNLLKAINMERISLLVTK